MTSIPEYTGLRVHKIIGSLIWNLQHGEDFTLEEQIIRDACDRDFRESLERMWRASPKRNHNFFEDYYGGGLSDAQKATAKDRNISCVGTFIFSPTAEKLKLYSRDIEWLHFDTPNSFPSFLLDGIKLFALQM